MRVTILGTCSGISMPGRGHASVALEAGEGLYFLDLGEPMGREALSAGLPLERLRAAFLTHMHSDHSGGMVQFVKNLHLYHNHPEYLPQVDSFTLAVPSEAVEAVKDYMAACYMFPERTNVRVDYLPVEAGPVYRDRDVSVTAHPTGHLCDYEGFLADHPEYAGPRCQAFAYEVESGGRKVFYSGDLSAADEIAEAARGSDLLLLEAAHVFPLEETLKVFASRDIERLVLTHIFPDYNDRAGELLAAAEEALPGRVSVASDGDVFEIE